MPWLMERQLDRTAARHAAKKSLEAKGLALPPRSEDGSAGRRRRRPRGRRQARVGRDAAGRPRGDGGRHTAQFLARKVRGSSLRPRRSSSTTRCRRSIRASTRSASASRIAARRYGLVAPLFEMAKVCANHLAGYGIGALRGVAGVDQAQGDRRGSLLRRRFHGRRGHRGHRARGSRGRHLQEARDPRRQARRRRAVRRHGGRRVVLQAGARRPQRRRASATGSMFGESNLGDTGHEGQSRALAMSDDAEVCGCNGVCKGDDRQGHQGEGPLHARRRAQAHQGVVVLRLVHGPRRAVAHGDRGRRLLGPGEAEAGVRLHRPHAPGRARRDPLRSTCSRSRRRCACSSGARPMAARRAGPRSTTTSSRPGRRRRSTIRSRASSTSARTPTSRRTARTR